jgi:hypothetical protein
MALAAESSTAGEEVAAEAPGEGVPEDTLPGPTEAAEGGAPEVITHKERADSNGDELSPEEQALHIPGADNQSPDQEEEYTDEDTDTAALAEGRANPPTDTSDEPRSPEQQPLES